MRGIITRIIPQYKRDEKQGGGYGFIRDEEDNDRFFHMNDVRDLKFEDLDRDDEVTFEPLAGGQGRRGNGGNGLRAVKVRRVS